MTIPVTITLYFNVRQDEESFEAIFLERLNEALAISQWGEVVEHSVQREERGEPRSSRCALKVPALHDKQIEGLVELLSDYGAPLGSLMRFQRPQDESIQARAFGRVKGFALYLDGVTLDPKIYKKYDLDRALEAVDHELGESGAVYGYWQGPRETAIYAYGDQIEVMREELKRLRSKHPLFRGAREERLSEELKHDDLEHDLS